MRNYFRHKTQLKYLAFAYIIRKAACDYFRNKDDLNVQGVESYTFPYVPTVRK